LTELRRVAKARDAAGLRALCVPDVITGIDMKPGPDELLRQMQAGGWDELQRVLTFGAGRYEGGFAIPHFFARFPDDLESTEHMVTIRPGAVLRQAGRANAATVCPLDYDILRVPDARPVNGWIQAERLDGPKGWVAEAEVRSLGARRIFLERKSGAWKVTAWAGGA